MVASRFVPLRLPTSRTALIMELALTVTIDEVLNTCISTCSNLVRVVDFRGTLVLLVVASTVPSLVDRCENVRLLMHLYDPVRPAHDASLTLVSSDPGD